MALRAEIIAVGSELLTPLRSDSNALVLTARLREMGIDVVMRTTVADDAGLLEGAFRNAIAHEPLQLFRRARHPGLELNESDGQFTGVRIRLADRGGERHRFARHERIFDDAWVDVVAAADDEILGATVTQM